MSWKAFEEQAPEMAALGIEKLNRKVAYLAILKRDGSPRLHPITPFIGDGMLFSSRSRLPLKSVTCSVMAGTRFTVPWIEKKANL